MEVRRRVQLLAAERVTEGITGELALALPKLWEVCARGSLRSRLWDSAERGRRQTVVSTLHPGLAPSR